MPASHSPTLQSQQQKWDPPASSYLRTVGRASTIAADHLIALAHRHLPLDTPSANAIDLGAGTGSVALALRRQFPSLPVLATDISGEMLRGLRGKAWEQGEGEGCDVVGESEERNRPGSSVEGDGDGDGDGVVGGRKKLLRTAVLDMGDPIGQVAPEGAFSHVFSSMTMQEFSGQQAVKVVRAWRRLLLGSSPSNNSQNGSTSTSTKGGGGLICIGLWIQNTFNCGPYMIWEKAARAVDPSYRSPPLFPRGEWASAKQLEEGMKEAGLEDVEVFEVEIGFNIGAEDFMLFFWESGNPMPKQRMATFNGDLERVREAMGRLLEVEYEGGRKIPLRVAVGVGRG